MLDYSLDRISPVCKKSGHVLAKVCVYETQSSQHWEVPSYCPARGLHNQQDCQQAEEQIQTRGHTGASHDLLITKEDIYRNGRAQDSQSYIYIRNASLAIEFDAQRISDETEAGRKNENAEEKVKMGNLPQPKCKDG